MCLSMNICDIKYIDTIYRYINFFTEKNDSKKLSNEDL